MHGLLFPAYYDINIGMEYALEERIGNPELFIGRKGEMAYFLKWLDDIKERKSQSTAILARRKMGKTAFMERLFNITFYKNDGVIPFYLYSETLEKLKSKYNNLLGKFNYQKGEAEDYCREKGIACSDDEKWLEVS